MGHCRRFRSLVLSSYLFHPPFLTLSSRPTSNFIPQPPIPFFAPHHFPLSPHFFNYNNYSPHPSPSNCSSSQYNNPSHCHHHNHPSHYPNHHPYFHPFHHNHLNTLLLILSLLILPVPLLPSGTGEVDPDSLSSGIGRFNSILCEDIDGDGRNEILFGSYEGYIVSVEYRDGDYSVDWTSPKFGTRAWGLTVGQFDEDSSLEVIVGDGDGIVRSIDGTTKEIEWESEELVRDAHGLLLHDVDRDGENELLVGTGFKTDQPWGQIFLFRRNSTEHYDAFDPFDSRLRELHVADVDYDGEEELIVGSGVSLGDVGGEGYLRVFDLDTKELEWKSPDLKGCVEGLRVVDLDGDGILEIIASNGYRYREGYCYVFQFNGNGYDRLWKSSNIGPKAYGLDVRDIDKDGEIEIVIGNLAGYVYVFNGLTYEEEWRSDNLGRDILGITIGDPDSDGELEIVAGQGGYIGKGDYTSGYVTPHVYVIDGRTHEIEAVIGEEDALLQWLKVAILISAVVGISELAIIGRKRAIARSVEHGS